MQREGTSNSERLIQALEQLLTHRRFAELSASQISAQAGVSRATFYRNFETKTDLLIAAILSGRDHSGDAERVTSDDTTLVDLEIAVRTRMGDNPLALALLRAALEMQYRDPRVARLLAQREAQCRQFWISYTRRAKDLGLAVAGEPEEIGALVDRFVQSNAFAAVNGQLDLNGDRIALIADATARIMFAARRVG